MLLALPLSSFAIFPRKTARKGQSAHTALLHYAPIITCPGSGSFPLLEKRSVRQENTPSALRNRLRHFPRSLFHAVRLIDLIGSISAKQLVPAIAAQGNRHMLPRQLADQIGRDLGRNPAKGSPNMWLNLGRTAFASCSVIVSCVCSVPRCAAMAAAASASL